MDRVRVGPAMVKALWPYVLIDAVVRAVDFAQQNGYVSGWTVEHSDWPDTGVYNQWRIQWGGGGGGRPPPYWLIFFSKCRCFRVKGIYFVVRISDK